eukprot:g17851.t1
MLSGVGGPKNDAATADSGGPAIAPPRGLQASDFAPLWETSSEKEWTELITTLIHQYGADAVEKWKHSSGAAARQQEQQKPYNVFEPGASTAAPDLNQGSRIIHLCVLRNFPALLHTLVCDYDFDVDITRDSDRNTAMHLALFETRKKDMVEKLDYLGADLTRKNAYGIECEKAFQAFQNSKENIIFLDLELTKGRIMCFYEGEDEVGIPRRIMELACVITDKNLRELGRGSWVIKGFSKEFLLTLPYFHQKNFRDSGHGREFEPIREARTRERPDEWLISQCQTLPLASGIGGKRPAPGASDIRFLKDVLKRCIVLTCNAESECLSLIKEYCPEGACPLSGNSIQCDREILYTETPSIYHYLSHRIIDVSSFLGVAERWMPHKIEMWRAHQRQVSNYNHRALDDTLSSIQSMAWIRENMLLPSDHKLAEWEAEKAWEEEERWQGSEDEEDGEEAGIRLNKASADRRVQLQLRKATGNGTEAPTSKALTEKTLGHTTTTLCAYGWLQ